MKIFIYIFDDGSCTKPIPHQCNTDEDIKTICDALYDAGYSKCKSNTDYEED